jgi:hypothetical protein
MDELGQAKVENLRVPVRHEEDVLGLQIAVNDALVVRGGQSVCDVHGIVDRASHGKRAVRVARTAGLR